MNRGRSDRFVAWGWSLSILVHAGVLGSLAWLHDAPRSSPRLAFREGERSIEIRLLPPVALVPPERKLAPEPELRETMPLPVLPPRIEIEGEIEPAPASEPEPEPSPEPEPEPESEPEPVVLPALEPHLRTPPTESATASTQEGIREPAWVTRRPQPRYPRSCRRLGHQGTALLEVVVAPTGRVVDVHVVRSAGCPELDEAAIRAVSDARFQPARDGGIAVGSTVRLPIQFVLR